MTKQEMIHDVWEKWCSEAAADVGITVDDLKSRLEAGQGYLDIKATVKYCEPKNELANDPTRPV